MTTAIVLGTMLVSGSTRNPLAHTQASGTLAPSGPPLRPPVRIAAGTACIVDLTQPYVLTGLLAGSATIDYRIFVDGECGMPAGTFNEHWIAHGVFEGMLAEDSVSTHFSYVAQVRAGGDVEGTIVLGDSATVILHVQGNLRDDRLSYEARVR